MTSETQLFKTARSTEMLLGFLCFSLSLFFFTTGPFEFFDLLDAKRATQVSLLIVIAVLAPSILMRRFQTVWKEPLVLLALCFLLSEVFVSGHSLSITEMVFATVLVALVVCCESRYADQILKGIVALAAVFSVMGTIESFALLLRPELIPLTTSTNMQPISGGEYTILHPLDYLGTTSGELRSVFGVELVRVNSFMREPSLVVLYFTLPAILALTFRDRSRWLALPIFVFSFLCLTGAFYAVIIIAIPFAVLMSLPVIKRSVPALTWISVLSAGLALFLTLKTDFFQIILPMIYRSDFMVGHIQNLEFLDRMRNALVRMDTVRDFASNIDVGSSESQGQIPTAVGLVFYSMVKASFAGACLMVWFLYRMFQSTVRCRVENRIGLWTAAMLIAVYVQAAFFNMYGFMSASGFLINALAIKRLHSLQKEAA